MRDRTTSRGNAFRPPPASTTSDCSLPTSEGSGSQPTREHRNLGQRGDPTLAPQAWPPGTLLAGKYEVLGLLGSGGMGTVLAARNRVLDAVVAVKVLRGGASGEPGRAERLIREARAVAQLNHPNVVRVFDAGSLESGAPFVVMERLFGTDLDRVLREQGPLAPLKAARYVMEACRGLAAAHDAGLVHRDLKPANLFLTQGPSQPPAIKVLDFGVSKLRPSEDGLPSVFTEEGVVMGSPHYMSPEQLRSSRDAQPRSDLWALGVVLFRLVTGRYPFDAPSVPALAVAIACEAPAAASARELPRPLRQIVQRCLEKDPARRFSSARELERALSGYVENPPPRTRSVVLLGAGLIAVLVALALVLQQPSDTADVTVRSSLAPAPLALPAPAHGAPALATADPADLVSPLVQSDAREATVFREELRTPATSERRSPVAKIEPRAVPVADRPLDARPPEYTKGVGGAGGLSLRDHSAVYDRK